MNSSLPVRWPPSKPQTNQHILVYLTKRANATRYGLDSYWACVWNDFRPVGMVSRNYLCLSMQWKSLCSELANAQETSRIRLLLNNSHFLVPRFPTFPLDARGGMQYSCMTSGDPFSVSDV